MIPFILSALSYIVRNPRILVMAATGLFVGFLYLQLQISNHRLDSLKVENENLKTAVASLEVSKETLESNDIILTQRIVKQEEISKELDAAIAEIDAAPATDDGPVSPVLKRAIEGKKSSK